MNILLGGGLGAVRSLLYSVLLSRACQSNNNGRRDGRLDEINEATPKEQAESLKMFLVSLLTQ